jgi:hypothetical protein
MRTRILALGVLSTVSWAMLATNAQAFHLLDLCCHHHCKPECRPYNAFSPVCCVYPSCCPLPYCGGCQSPIQPFVPSMCDNNCYGGSCIASEPSYVSSGPAMVIPSPSQVPMAPTPSPGFTPPPPTASPVYNQTSMQWNPQAAYVQPAGYSPYPMNNYPVNFNPVNNYPVMPPMQVPSYWYNGR